jgi:lysozyme
MKISQTGIDLIKDFEGFRSEPYRCSANVPTIGFGSTLGITMESAPITLAEGEALLKRDLVRFERAVHRLCYGAAYTRPI